MRLACPGRLFKDSVPVVIVISSVFSRLMQQPVSKGLFLQGVRLDDPVSHWNSLYQHWPWWTARVGYHFTTGITGDLLAGFAPSTTASPVHRGVTQPGPLTCADTDEAALQRYLRSPQEVLCIMSSMMEGDGRKEPFGQIFGGRKTPECVWSLLIRPDLLFIKPYQPFSNRWI